MGHYVLHPEALQGNCMCSSSSSSQPTKLCIIHITVLYTSSTVDYVRYSIWYTAATKHTRIQHLLDHPRPGDVQRVHLQQPKSQIDRSMNCVHGGG
jgi:hypothetical protein